MANDAMVSLPGEIIAYILEDKCLDFLDVVHFSLTNKSYYKAVNESNKLWKTKFLQRWPLLEEIYQTYTKSDQTINWKEETKVNVQIRKMLYSYLSLMSSKHYRKEELSKSDFIEYNPLFRPEEGAHPLAYYFLVDELINLIQYPTIGSNLTHRYYSFKVVRYLKHCHLKEEWQKFISLPQKQQTLERGATIVSQWIQPERHVTYSAISSVLDNIAEQTKELLREKYPAHTIFSVSPDTFNDWKNNIINDNQWSAVETRQVTDALCEVLFNKLGFYGNAEMYYSSESSLIDCVLERKCGIPVTLAIVFESVARRLGIRCEPISFPSHFLLRWKEKYGPESNKNENFYIDVFNGGRFLTKKNCPRIGGVSKCPIDKYNVIEAASTVKVVKRMANNLEVAFRQHVHINDRTSRLCSALELRLMIQPNDENTILHLSRIYMAQRMDITEIVKMLENTETDLELSARRQLDVISQTLLNCQKCLEPEEEVKPKLRFPGVKFAIGLITRHTVHGYIGVIIGWDTHWIEDIAEPKPIYCILSDDGSTNHVIQDHLSLVPNPVWISHHAIGKYFCKFDGTRYIPNEETVRDYPEDEKACKELLFTYVQNGVTY